MSNNYIYVKAPPAYPGRVYSWGHRILEHHLVWWEHTSQVVPEGYVVHHKNENRADNRFENLELLSDSAHTRLHHLLEEDRVLLCAWCGAEIVRAGRDVRAKTSAGQKNFFCCSSHAAFYGGTLKGEFKHGTPSSYRYQKCRCALCKQAHAERIRQYRKRRAASDNGQHTGFASLK